jgi:hypothetical protein
VDVDAAHREQRQKFGRKYGAVSKCYQKAGTEGADAPKTVFVNGGAFDHGKRRQPARITARDSVCRQTYIGRDGAAVPASGRVRIRQNPNHAARTVLDRKRGDSF